MCYYVGVTAHRDEIIFRSVAEPTRERFGHHFKLCTGPYRTKQAAISTHRFMGYGGTYTARVDSRGRMRDMKRIDIPFSFLPKG